MKNISSFTDPQVVPNLYLFICFSCWTQKEMFWWSDGWWELYTLFRAAPWQVWKWGCEG